MLASFKRRLIPILTPILRWRRVQHGRAQIQQQVTEKLAQGEAVKVVLGAGVTQFDGWIKTDLPYFDVLNASHWRQLFPPNAIHRLLAEHVFEHLTTEQFARFLHLAKPYLADKGRIRIAVPDGNHPDTVYIDRVRPNGTGEGADDHKVLYTYELITPILENAGYDYQLVEYFDTAGEFHQIAWDTDDGMIARSADYDARNQAKPLTYTSLIVDCWVS